MKKKFDAVAMKHEIQERQRRRLKGLSPAEESRLIHDEIMKGDELARFLKNSKRTAGSKRS